MSQLLRKRWFAVMLALAATLIGAGSALAGGFGAWGY
jgi:hypothetical protein